MNLKSFTTRRNLAKSILNCVHWTGNRHHMIDNREMMFSGRGVTDAADAIFEILEPLEFDAIACHGVGGLPLGTALKERLPAHISLFFVREVRKGYDFNKLVEGPPMKAGMKVWIVDDLINRGRTYDKVSKAILDECPTAQIMGMVVLVDYGAYGSRQLAMRGVDVKAVFDRPALNLARPKTAGKKRFEKVWQNLSIGSKVRSGWPNIIRSFPVIAGDRMVVGTDSTSFVCCDKLTGEPHWVYQSLRTNGKGVASQPQVFGQNVITSSYDGVVRSFDIESGEIQWQAKVDSFVHSTPQIVDGLIYLGTEGRVRRDHYGDIICLEAQTGKEHWRVETKNQIPTTPLVIPEKDRIVCSSNDRNLYCMNLDGEIQWVVNTGQDIKGRASHDEGRIYTTSNQGYCECRSLDDGSIIWRRKVGSSLHHNFPPILDRQIILTMNESESAIASLDKMTGDVLWYNMQRAKPAFTITLDQPYDPLLINHGYCVMRNGDLAKINLDTGKTQWIDRLIKYGSVNSPVVIDFPYIYIITDRVGMIAYTCLEEQ